MADNQFQPNMTIAGYQDEQGRQCISLKFDYETTEAFKEGKPIVRRSGDSQGDFKVTAQLTRK